MKRKAALLLLCLPLLLSLFLSNMVGAALAIGDFGSWTSSTSLPGARKEAASASYNGYAYVIGGRDSDSMFAPSLTTVYYASMNTNGSVGAWQTGTSLPTGLSSLSAVTYNGYIYAIGGRAGASVVATVYYAKLNADGSLGSWQTATSLPSPRQIGAATAYNGYVYLLGGSQSSYSNAVFYAKINADGSLGTWQTASNPMPQPNQAFNTIAYNGYLYDIGGTDNAVYYAKLNTDGSPGTWQTASNALPDDIGYNQVVLVNGFVYLAGGYAGSTLASSIYAKLNADGSPGAWQSATATLPYGIWLVGAATNGHHIYLLGGHQAPGVLATVFSAPLDFPATTTAIVNAVNSAPVTVKTPASTYQTCASPVTASTGQPDSFSYPLGLVNVCYNSPNSSDQIKLVFVTNLSPSQVVARNYNPSTQTYTTIAGAAITATTYNGQPALELTYSVVDNGPLDSNPEIGIINDPVGLAIGAVGAPATGYGQPASRNPMIIRSVVGTLLIAAGMVSARRQSSRFHGR